MRRIPAGGAGLMVLGALATATLLGACSSSTAKVSAPTTQAGVCALVDPHLDAGQRPKAPPARSGFSSTEPWVDPYGSSHLTTAGCLLGDTEKDGYLLQVFRWSGPDPTPRQFWTDAFYDCRDLAGTSPHPSVNRPTTLGGHPAHLCSSALQIDGASPSTTASAAVLVGGGVIECRSTSVSTSTEACKAALARAPKA